MDRTLYLSEKEKMTVITDGQSILVKEKAKADRRVPSRLIERVIIIGNVKLDSSSITLFTERSVPVTFLDNSGRVLATVMKYSENFRDRMAYQYRFVADGSSLSEFREFAFSKRKNLMLYVIRDFNKTLWHIFVRKGFSEKDFRSFISKNIKADERDRNVVSSFISGLLHETALKIIIANEFDPHFGIINRGKNFGFVKDFLFMMDAEKERQLLMFFRNKQGKEILRKTSSGLLIDEEFRLEIINRYENRLSLIKNEIEFIFDDFFKLIREVSYGKFIPCLL
jgi:CRISPR/Cas system-associated endonuclease Cas1